MTRVVSFLGTHLDIDELLGISKPQLIYPENGGWGVRVQLAFKCHEDHTDYYLKALRDEVEFVRPAVYLIEAEGKRVRYEPYERFSEDQESRFLIYRRMESSIEALVKEWKG